MHEVFSRRREPEGGVRRRALGSIAANGAATLTLILLGDYNPADFVHRSGPKGRTLTGYT
jgi:hypothetical protein